MRYLLGIDVGGTVQAPSPGDVRRLAFGYRNVDAQAIDAVDRGASVTLVASQLDSKC